MAALSACSLAAAWLSEQETDAIPLPGLHFHGRRGQPGPLVTAKPSAVPPHWSLAQAARPGQEASSPAWASQTQQKLPQGPFLEARTLWLHL